jgi:LPS sulfotransferase NodH
VCDLLSGTGVAGRPREYFFDGDYSHLFEEFSVSDFPDYLKAVVERTPTANGVFGVKFMYYYLNDFIERVNRLPKYHARKLKSFEVMSSVFARPKYIWLTRRDKVRQSVSLMRAVQSGIWHTFEDDKAERQPVLSEEFLDRALQSLVLQDSAWQEFFVEAGVTPLTLVYEDLVRSPEKAIQRICDYVEIPLQKNWTIDQEKTSRKLADATSEQFIQSYRDKRRSMWLDWKDVETGRDPKEKHRLQTEQLQQQLGIPASLSPVQIAQHATAGNVLKAAGLKFAAKLKLRWLYRFLMRV